MTFGKLKVIGIKEENKSGKPSKWKYKCICECGNIKDISRLSLVLGKTQSCGCIHREIVSNLGKSNKKINKTIFEETVVKIYLTPKKYTIINKEDYNKIKKFYWSLRNNRAVKNGKTGEKNTTFLHHLILPCPDTNHYIDHINGNPLDNRKENLRIVTYSENSKNRTPNCNKQIPFIGVSYTSYSKEKYRARIKVEDKNIALGTFDTLKEAVQARIDAEIYYFKEYAPCLCRKEYREKLSNLGICINE